MLRRSGDHRYRRVVMHVDLDYFFAQVEERLNPSIADKPVVVCVFSGRGGDSGAVSSANYIARSYGVKAGIPIYRAKKLLQNADAAFLPMRRELYEEYSNKVMEILRGYADVMEVESIDEATLDITEKTGGDYAEAEQLAARLKKHVKNETGLTCTVGVAPNRVVAKIAADVAKPDGVKIVKPSEVESFLKDLPVKKLPGVGDKIAKLLNDIGVETIGDLASADLLRLSKLLGKAVAEYLKLAAMGVYDEPIEEKQERKQISRIITLQNNTRDVDDIARQLEKPVQDLLEIARRNDVDAEALGIIAITKELKIITRSHTIRTIPPKDELLRIVRSMFKNLLAENPEMMLRRAGVRLHNLKKRSGQTTLTSFG